VSLILSDFMDIVASIVFHAQFFFTATNEAILISSPVEISLFAAMFGFVVLEFFLFTLNRLRGADLPQISQSTGKNPDRLSRAVNDRNTGIRGNKR